MFGFVKKSNENLTWWFSEYMKCHIFQLWNEREAAARSLSKKIHVAQLISPFIC